MTNWYCIRTLPRKEQVASEALKGIGLQTLSPQIRTVQVTRYRTNPITASLFPTYLFACLDYDAYYAKVKKTHGVSYFVGFDGSPFVVPQMMIEEIAYRMDGDGFVETDDQVRARLPLEPGQEVSVVTGPFENLNGLFVRDEKSRIVVLMNFLGGQREIPMPRDYVRPVV